MPFYKNKKLIILLIFIYMGLILSPIVTIIINSFIKQNTFTISAYEKILQDRRSWKIFIRTTLIGLTSAIITTLIGIALAYLLEKTIFPLKKLFKLVYIIPLIIPSYLIALGWTKFLNWLPGNLNLYNIPGVIFIMVLSYFPMVTLILIAGFRNIDYRLEEAAKLFTTKFIYFRKITLPLLLPYILTSIIVIFILTFSEYAMPELLRVNVYALETFIQFNSFHDFKTATATSLPILIVTITLVFIMNKIMSNKPYVTIGGQYKYGRPEKLGKLKIYAVSFILLILLLSTILPISSLIIKTVNWTNYLNMFKSMKNEIIYSVFLSFTGATLCTILCLFMAYGLEKSKGILKQVLNTLTLIPFAIPTTIVGIGLIKLWNRPPTLIIYSSLTSLLLGYLICFNPYGIRIISSNIKAINKQVKESTSLLNIPKFISFYKITLPLITPSLVVTWIVMCIFCLSEIPLTLLIIPPGESTLLTKMETIIHIGSQQALASISLVYITIIFLIISFLLPFAKLRKL